MQSLAFPALFPYGDDPGACRLKKANHTSTLQHFYRFGRKKYDFEEGKQLYTQPFAANKMWLAYACNKIQRDTWRTGCHVIVANSSDLKQIQTKEDVSEVLHDTGLFTKLGNKIRFVFSLCCMENLEQENLI